MGAGFTKGLLRRPFLGSIQSGTHFAAIRLSKSSAMKSSCERHELLSELKRPNIFTKVAATGPLTNRA